MIRILNFLLKHIIKTLVRLRGFLDPFDLMDKLSRFGKPSEVMAPTELLRHGTIMHARGLLNSQAIQHNLDWVWPYWVERQFDPGDPSFVPRSFSLTHINLTHRNWTAVGLPGVDEYPIVDPRGLVMPHHDSWSLDGWVLSVDGESLFPSQLESARQTIEWDENLVVRTVSDNDSFRLQQDVRVISRNGQSVCEISYRVEGEVEGSLGIAVRPYNPEGIHLLNQISTGNTEWTVNGVDTVEFSRVPEGVLHSHYEKGDVANRYPEDLSGDGSVNCSVGMANAVALYDLEEDPVEVSVSVPMDTESESTGNAALQWQETRASWTELSIPESELQFLFESAQHTLTLLTPDEAYPGPFTYKRFWYRDAVMMLHALLVAGMTTRAQRLVKQFPRHQKSNGYFCSQQGEWDSNGQVLWGIGRFQELTGKSPRASLIESMKQGAEWIINKREAHDAEDPHDGLLPAGFSAEHFGPNDHYYWDDFWAVGGLREAARLLQERDQRETAERFRTEADQFQSLLEDNIERAGSNRSDAVMPGAPTRRPDAGSIGTLVAGYPLKLWEPSDDRLVDTADYLRNNHFYGGGFFQDMMHSGINPYLTLHVAQVNLRSGQGPVYDLVKDVADRASSTGQWPEAVHPRTGGGCMGDGQHGWAAAEWIVMIRNMILREESGDLIVGSGVPEHWLEDEEPVCLSEGLTPFGSVDLRIRKTESGTQTVEWESDWRRLPDTVRIELAGYDSKTVAPEESPVVIETGS